MTKFPSEYQIVTSRILTDQRTNHAAIVTDAVMPNVKELSGEFGRFLISSTSAYNTTTLMYESVLIN